MSKADSKVQGEGDYKSAKAFNKKTKKFVQDGRVEKNKKDHRNLTQKEKNEGIEASEKAKSRGRN